MRLTKTKMEEAYAFARERYAEHGVDTDEILGTLDLVPISIQCGQGDDLLGF